MVLVAPKKINKHGAEIGTSRKKHQLLEARFVNFREVGKQKLFVSLREYNPSVEV